ncbi:MAG TPA: hypothetical protein VK178_02205 [Opitutaceae bacterium]|nr:hypothetical protein [Opitutaceae bacterium]
MTKTTTFLVAAGAFAAAFALFTGNSASVSAPGIAWEQPPYPPPLPGDDKTQKAADESEVQLLLAWEQPPYPTPLPGDDKTQKATARAATVVA